MKVNTTRFGELEVDKKDVINFKEGLLGFENLTKFFIVDPGDQTLILWLQSADDASVAFPMLEPKIFKQDYMVKLLPVELQSLELESVEGASVYSVLSIPTAVTEMTANLKAPIIINNKTKAARQIVLQDNKLDVQYPMYIELKRYIMNFHDDSQKVNKVAENVQNKNNERPAPRDLEM